ncbi:MAG: hypothetical protein OER95_01645 [Acidimicrobiia bacterium]|nr:hypothetical protein [Acidimicrobiia bacterium]
MDNLTIPVVAGGHDGVVRWDPTLHTYSAWVDVFGLVDRCPSHRVQTSWDGSVESAWSWLNATGYPASTPLAVFGHRFGRHLTIDSLGNELARRGLPLDSKSWQGLVELRRTAARSCGEVIVVVESLDDQIQRPAGRGNHDHAERQGSVGLALLMPDRSRVTVSHRLINDDHRSPRNGEWSLLEAGLCLVELVWAREGDDLEVIGWEVAFEILDRPGSFSLVVASIADWIAYGSGLQWVDPGPPPGDPPPSFRQLALQI